MDPLAGAIAEYPDVDAVLMLININLEKVTGRSYLPWLSIQSAVTDQVPSEDWKGAYIRVPALASELRQELFGMTSNGGANDPAARCLNVIDELRDEYGAPEAELRHPDLASGRPWPMV